ncbi:hypothetical protein ACERJO_14960 [Halalkalibacter sp. AB-rgal2]|uniref:hypothetical protein n=1 Tax=Halalkalibacter sp. AB-rgal2 TaxID=3242695 RepID=UPI00359E21E0
MLFESFQDIIPLLLSMSIFLTVASYKVLQYMERSLMIKQRMLTKSSLYSFDVFIPSKIDPIGPMQRRQTWLTCLTKRKESPEDDGDYGNSSLTNEIIRGGFIWNDHLYSHHRLKGFISY